MLWLLPCALSYTLVRALRSGTLHLSSHAWRNLPLQGLATQATVNISNTGPEIIKPMLNLAEHEILKAHKHENTNINQHFAGSYKPRMLFFLLINVKMPTVVGILTFMSRKILCSAELSMIFITSGPDISKYHVISNYVVETHFLVLFSFQLFFYIN